MVVLDYSIIRKSVIPLVDVNFLQLQVVLITRHFRILQIEVVTMVTELDLNLIANYWLFYGYKYRQMVIFKAHDTELYDVC